MGFKCGIVGLPNVGKSTLFNALLSVMQAQAANYPFCTIDPNVGRVEVPDERLQRLATLANSARTVPTQLEFVDIAGLVRGASKNEGLGNQFLAHIREVDAILHVLRCFEDGDIVHVEGRVDPLADAEIVETELLLADLESLERRLPGVQKKAKGGDPEAVEVLPVMTRILEAIAAGQPARSVVFTNPTDQRLVSQMQLLTAKPILYVCNVEEAAARTGNKHTEAVAAMAARLGASSVVVSAKIEAEISLLPTAEDKQLFLEAVGLQETGLARVIRVGYDLLNLITYFTVGPKEARAWTITKGTLAPQAAGVIHSDFERAFIRAETISFADFITHEGESGAKKAGKLRVEGKEYMVQDGDVMHFRCGV